ncbi:exo-alpha-sialidase [Streptomyces sp. NPDC004126]|uniref:exo-alpha-sialidase n=1 Tax=Streptomyces sp. NPDC004126 TaxID=3390695 RepID=UPI003D02367A
MASALAVLCAAFSVLALPASTAGATSITGGHAQVFNGKDNDEYACFRSPAVVKAKDGALLAFAEGRIGDCGDSRPTDIVLKRQEPGSSVWGPLKVVARHAPGSGRPHNPVPIADTTNGNPDRVVLLYSWNFDGVFRTVSDDGGKTWGEARDISASVWPADAAKWGAYPGGQMSVGPAHGIQLAQGARAGRMMAGIWLRKAPGTPRQSDMTVGLVYSDDNGMTWQLGAHSLDAEPAIGAQEASLLERGDGSVLVVARNEEGDPATRNRAVYATSADGGVSFENGLQLLPDLGLPSGGVQASVLAVPLEGREGITRTLLAAPAPGAGSPAARKNLTIRSSFDGGRTWQGPDRGAVVREGFSAYSDMVALGEGRYGILYEGGEAGPYEFIRFATFTEADLDGDLPTDAGSLNVNQHGGALATSNPSQLHFFSPTTDGTLGNWFRNADGSLTEGAWGNGSEGAAVSFASGTEQHVLVRGGGGSLLHRFWAPGGSVTQETWTDAGTAVAGTPAAIVIPGQQHAFARSTKGELLHIWKDAGTASLQRANWAPAGTLAGDPVALVYGEQQHVWAAGSDGRLHHWWWTRNHGVRHEVWSGSVKGAPTAFVFQGQQHVYASDKDGRLAHWWWDYRTQAVKRQVMDAQRLVTGRPSAFVHGDQQHVFARTKDNKLAQWWWDQSTRTADSRVWEGALHSDPVAYTAGGAQHVFGADPDGRLTHWSWSSTTGLQKEFWDSRRIPTTPN